MNNRQVAHVWAQQSGKDANGSNFHSRGETIYSYGSHFPIARFDGLNVVLFVDHGYSNSTSKHINYTRQAVPSRCKVFHVNNPRASTKPEHIANFQEMKTQALQLISTLPRLRSRKAETIDRINGIIAHANEYAAHYKIGKRIRLPGNTAEDLAALRTTALKAEEKAFTERKRKERERDAKLYDEAKQVLADWLAGGRDFPQAKYLDGIQFRLIEEGATIQSTLGAEFPADHARRAWPMLQRIKGAGEPWQRNGQQIHLGHFQIDSIDEGGNIVAGCHRIKWAEVVRVAGLLGLETGA